MLRALCFSFLVATFLVACDEAYVDSDNAYGDDVATEGDAMFPEEVSPDTTADPDIVLPDESPPAECNPPKGYQEQDCVLYHMVPCRLQWDLEKCTTSCWEPDGDPPPRFQNVKVSEIQILESVPCP